MGLFFTSTWKVKACAMNNSISTVYDISPKHNLPTELSIMEEGKHSRAREFSISTSASPSIFQKIVAELIGTYILIFVGCGAALVDRERELTLVGIAMAQSLVLMVLIYAIGHVSGAHFNPAVTIALAAGAKFPLKQVPLYIASQFSGSTLACLTLRVLFNNQKNILPALTQFSTSITQLEAIAWEFILTFMLMFTICGVATDDRADKPFAGVAIGATLLFNILIAGPITGASMNPMRSVGPAIVSGVYKNLWVYVVSPILGALAATLAYSVLRVSKPNESEENSKNLNKEAYLYSDP